MNRVAVVGEGIDCVRLVAEILADAGVIDRPRFPFYDERLGALREHNIIETILIDHLHAVALEPGDSAPEFGDIIVCRCGRQSNHVGIYLDAVWHAAGGGRCGPEEWSPRWRERTQSLVRVTAIGYRAEPSGLTWAQIKKKLPNV